MRRESAPLKVTIKPRLKGCDDDMTEHDSRWPQFDVSLVLLIGIALAALALLMLAVGWRSH